MPATEVRSPTRRLTVFAADPSVRVAGKIVTSKLELPTEHLKEGPAGYRVHVIDYDSSTDRLLAPGAISGTDQFAEASPNSLIEDPRFHAQNTYAIVMGTLSRFERALGRHVPWGFRGHQLKIAPHAFADANAYYSRDQEALMFGYFPGKRGTVFTCLSHDIVAHETAHALIDGLRSNFLLPSSAQQAAFHEGFSDVVAILSGFRLKEVLDAALDPKGRQIGDGLVIKREALTKESLRESTLLTLADQMGEELSGVRGDALRKSARLSRSPEHLLQRSEAHDLGEVFAAAMLNAFLEVWTRRLFPYGTRGVRMLDRIHVIDEGATAADHLLTMAIRALDYTPPVDLQFGDYLSALLTADAEIYPDDSKYGYREILTNVFHDYGISPAAKAWGSKTGYWMPLEERVDYTGTFHEEMRRDPEALFRFIWQNRDQLDLEPSAYTFVQSVRPTVRTNTSGFVVRETVVECVQILDIRADELESYDLKAPQGMNPWQRVRLNGGTVLIFDDRGRLRLSIGSGATSQRQIERLKYLFETGHFDERGATHVDLARVHRIRSGAPNLRNPYLPRENGR